MPTNNLPAVQVFALGGFRVMVRGEVLSEHAWRRKAARQLFKNLISLHNRRMTRDEVIELLWPDSDAAAASGNLRSTVHAMRRALESGDHDAGFGMVFTDRDCIWLRPDGELWVDADAFEHVVAQARLSSEPLPLLDQADVLYAGEYLPQDIYEDWASERRDRLKQLWANLQLWRSRELEHRGDVELAIQQLQRLVQADPCDERAAQEAMQLLARHGHRSEALKIYQHLAQVLASELGVDPSEETLALQRQITSGDVSAPFGLAYRCGYPFPSPARLIGRESELGVLERVLANGRVTGQAAMVGAPAGTGKSALVGQLVQRAQSQGVLCLVGGCYEERGTVPLGPFRDALIDFLLTQPADRLRKEFGSIVDDLAQIVPEVRYHVQSSVAEATSSAATDRTQAFGAVHGCLRRLAERGPVLICLEDLHAADEASIQLFHYLVRQMRRLPLVLIGTYRTDEAQPDQPLAQTVAAMQRQRLIEYVRVSPLLRGQTDDLVMSLLGGPPSDSLGETLFATTGGNPLFVEQLVLAMAEGRQVQRQGGVWNESSDSDLQREPHFVHEIIAERLLRLSVDCREMLSVAAVLGHTFEHRVLLAAVEPLQEAGLLRLLDEAIGAQILQSIPAGYAFRHALLHGAAYWSLNAPRRMLLHARVGELLEGLYQGNADEYAAELAYHFVHAGESTPVRARALRYSMHAGRRAGQLSSYPQALTQFRRACDLIDRDEHLADAATRFEALTGRGEAEADLALWPESLATFRRVLDSSADPLQRARARGRIAFAHQHTGDMLSVVVECQAVLTELSDVEGPEAAAARLYAQQLIAIGWYLQGRYNQVLQLGQEMLAAATPLNEVRPVVLARTVLGWGYMGLGLVDQALAEFEPGLAAAERSGEKIQRATMHENIGFQHYLGGRFAAAREHLSRALTLYHESASELRSVNALQQMCRVWVAEGEHVRAVELLLQAITLQTEGHERWLADGHHILGQIYALRAEWQAATISLELALEIRRQVGDTCGIVESIVGLGLVHQHTGDWTAAATAFDEAVEIAGSMDPAPCRLTAWRHRGRLHLLARCRTTAEADIERAFELAQTIPETLEYAPTLLLRAELCARDGDYEQGLALAQQALERSRAVEHIIEAHLVLADIHLSRSQPEAALHQATDALAKATPFASPRLMSLAHLALARAMAACGTSHVHGSFAAALREAEAAHMPFERAAALDAYAEYLGMFEASADRARVLAVEASAIRQNLGLPQRFSAS